MRLPALYKGRRRRHLLALFANGLLQALLATALAWQAQAMFDGQVMEPAGDYRSALEYAARLLLLSVLIALLRRRERMDAELLGQLYVRDLRKRLFARLLRSQHASIAAQRRGQLLIRFVSDLNAVRQWVSLGLARLGVAAIVISLVMVALWWLHPLFMLTVGGSLVLTAAALWRQGATLRQAIAEVRRRQGYLAANMTEKIAAVSTIQLFGQAERERRRLARQNRRVIQAAGEKAAAIGSLRAIIEIGVGLAFAAGLLVTAILASDGQVSPGTFVAVFTLIGFLSTPLRDVGRVHEYWLANRVALANIQRLMRRIRPLQLADAIYLDSEFSGALVFDELSLEGSVTSFSARVEAGQRVALVGPNGAGKTSLLHAIVRLREADRGDIRIDGVSIRDLPLEQLHGLVAYVGNDVPLLRATLRENLLYGARQVSEEALQTVIRCCGIDELVRRLPEGLDMRLQEGGVNLSQGQRARVALARALLKRPCILLLDEADAHLDLVAVKAFNQVLADFPGTVVMATHRREAVRQADIVWHLHDGRLVARGSPGELLQGDGPTQQLFSGPRPWREAHEDPGQHHRRGGK